MTLGSPVVYLAWSDLKSNMRPLRALLLLGLAMVAGFLEVRGSDSSMAHVQGALSLFGKYWVPDIIPLVAAAMGSSLASDRRRGITLAFLARGVSRSQYLSAKLLGAAASGGLLILAAIIGFYLMVGVQWPIDRVTWKGTDWYPGPLPALFEANPLANDLLAVSMCVISAAVLSMVGVLAGTFIANEYIAMATPPLFVILGVLLLRGALEPLSPYLYLNVWSGYVTVVSVELRALAPFLYWLNLGVLVSGMSLWVFNRVELG